jgi:hypothetical protein
MIAIASTVAVSVLSLACLALAGFMIFFPLVRTIVGGLQILRLYGLRRSVEADLRSIDSFISDIELGLTMADGGEKTGKGQAGTPGK